MMWEHTEDLMGRIVLLDMVMIIEPCISTPADMKGRVDVGFAPLHNLHQFRPILYFLEIVVLHRSAGNNKTVITLIFDLVKGCIEGVQVFRRRVAGTIRTGIEKIHIYLNRGVRELSHQLNLCYDLCRHEIED